MAKVAEISADRIIVTSDNPRTEDPDEIIADILEGFTDPNADHITVEPDRKKALGLAINSAQAGDIILLAGKGHETYQITGTEKTDFDDREIAAEFIDAGQNS
jgi:UDP-N-acetylmuramoyl-L-alanyl-D-glutamate--2,6-diaminopimelate ligase